MLTYNECLDLIKRGRNGQKKLGNNTYLVIDGADFCVFLHQTCVVRINKDGTYVLNSGGWRTSTTKQRINKYSPVKVSQRDFQWYVNGTTLFVEGMTVCGITGLMAA